MKINVNKRYAALANCFLVYLILLLILCSCTSTQAQLDKEWKDHWCESVNAWVVDYCETPKDCEYAEIQLQYFQGACK